MTTIQQISREHAQRIAVTAQALDHRPDQIATRADVLALVRRLGCVQIDTIHVVARSPYLVLYSRLGEYDPRWLDELLYPDRQVFEYWAHAASIIPIEHWPLFRAQMLQHGQSDSGWWEWRRDNEHVLAHVMDQIRERGPLGAADFAAPPDHKGGGWWEWKPAKRALDMLWTTGDLMIERRVNFHRRYDLRERVLPAWNDADIPSENERRRRLAAIALRAMGIATVKHLADYFRQRQDGLAAILESFAADGSAERVAVEGWPSPAYVYPSLAAYADQIAPTLTTLLSPFDNLIWHRERTLALWGFDYKLECYVPAPKRRYGYFVLPILRRGSLVGRLDAKAERKAGVFHIKALYLEPGVPVTADLIDDLAGALIDCARWQRTPDVMIEWSEPDALRAPLQQAIGAALITLGS